MSIDFDAYMIEYVIGDEISISTNVDGAASTINPVVSPEVGFIWEEDFENLLFGSFSDVVLIFPALNKAGDIIEYDDGALEFGSFTGVAGAVNPVLSDTMNEVSMFAKFWRPGDDMNEVIIGSPEEQQDDGVALVTCMEMVPIDINMCFVFSRAAGWQYRPLRTLTRFLGARNYEDVVTPYVPVNLRG